MKTKETTLDKIRTRPRFKMYTELSKEEYVQNLKKYMELTKETFEASINTEISTINVKTEENPFWKPYLSLRIENDESQNTATVIRGVFGPSSAVWTLFMFAYFLWSVLWMTFITMWFVEKQIQSNNYPWALGASFAILALALTTYIAAKIGQLRSKDELLKLRTFAEESTYPHEHLIDTENSEPQS